MNNIRNTQFDRFILVELELLKDAIEFTTRKKEVWFYKKESAMILEDIEAEIKYLKETQEV